LTCLGCGVKTNGGLAEACGSSYDGTGYPNVSTVAAPLSGSNPTFSLTLDTSELTPGRHYRLCLKLDRDDASGSFLDAGQAVYVTGVRSSVFASIAAAVSQPYMVECPEGCSTDTRLYLALACDYQDSDGVRQAVPTFASPSVALVPGVDPGDFTTTLNTSALSVGATYRVCADLDGVATSLAFGDTAVEVVLTALSSS